jgi:hypothetical protein
MHFEFESDIKRVTNVGDTKHGNVSGEGDEAASDCSTSTSVSDSDSVLLNMANDRSSEIPLKHDAQCDVTLARSRLSVNANTVLFNSDPNLLHSWEAENAQKYLSASFEMLPISGPDVSPSCSVTNLSRLRENGKHRQHNGFFPVKLRSQVLSWNTDRGTTFSSLPNLFSASNVPRQKEAIFPVPQSHHVIKPTDLNHKERLQTADTATSTVILRNQGAARTPTVGPQEAVEAVNRHAVYDIQWNFSKCKKMSCGSIATFELTSPLNDDKKLLPHQSRPKSSPADFCKFLQQLCLYCQQSVMSAGCLQTICFP